MNYELSLLLNTALMGYFLWSIRTFLRSHQEQHDQIAADNKALVDAIKNLAAVYASKDSVGRAHSRLDSVEDVQVEHSERLARVETRLDNGGVR